MKNLTIAILALSFTAACVEEDNPIAADTRSPQEIAVDRNWDHEGECHVCHTYLPESCDAPCYFYVVNYDQVRCLPTNTDSRQIVECR